MSLQEELLELERGFWNAAGDRDFYEVYFAEDGVAVFPMDDGLMTSERVLASVEGGQPWTNVEITNVQVVDLGPHCAGLVYEAVGSREGQPDYHAYLTSIYRRDDSRWQMVIHQQTPLPE